VTGGDLPDTSWLAAAGGYQVTLRSEQVVCRNAKGKELKSLPGAIKDDPAVFTLRELIEWLGRHQAQVRDDVDRWMVRSLPMPAVLLARVRPEEVWHAALTDLVVAVPGADGGWDPEQVLGCAQFGRRATRRRRTPPQRIALTGRPFSGSQLIRRSSGSAQLISPMRALPSPNRWEVFAFRL
jgi:Domain of unknown function (DUF4132)